MKKNINYIIILLVCFQLIGCKRGVLPGNSVYISSQASSNSNIESLTIDKEGAIYELVAKSSELASSDININYNISEKELTAYNEKNDTKYKLLPENYYSLSSNVAIIKEGSARSNRVSLKVESFDDLPDTNQYAIPVSIANISNSNAELIESSKTLFILLNKIIYTNVPLLNGNQSMEGTYKESFKDLTSWTFEWRVLATELRANNQILISSGQVFTRFGDVVINQNQLQIKSHGGQFSPAEEFEANKWYNFAITYDGANIKWYRNGTLIMSQPLPGKTYTFEGMHVGGGGGGVGTPRPRMFNEIRFWSVARTQSQIANNLYGVNPNSIGLEAYWKCNDNTGVVFKDFSRNKNDLKSSSSVTWISGIKMPPY